MNDAPTYFDQAVSPERTGADAQPHVVGLESASKALAPIAGEDPKKEQPQMRPGTIRVMFRAPPRNAPCPCGKGKKFKHCHGAHPSCRAK